MDVHVALFEPEKNQIKIIKAPNESALCKARRRWVEPSIAKHHLQPVLVGDPFNVHHRFRLSTA